MNANEINKTKQQVAGLLHQSRVAEAFSMLEPAIHASGVWSLREQLEQLQLSYRFMLQYFAQGIPDPQRHEVLKHIITQLHILNDQCAIALLEPQSQEVFFARRRELSGESLSGLIERYQVTINKIGMLSSVPEGQRDEQAIATMLEQSERQETSIFNIIWCSLPTTEEDGKALLDFTACNAVPVHAKCLVASALLLGLLRVYDDRKITLLADIYNTAADARVQLRAVVGLLLALKLHDHRARQSEAIGQRLQALCDNPQLPHDLGMAQFLLARTRNTENITRRVQHELMPGIMKMRPDMLKNMREQGADITDLEANPEWQQMLEDSGIARKMEEFNELQLDGSDVFIATFSRLKSFPFFQTLSNWFLPFHSDHSAVYRTFSGDDAPLRRLVERAPFLCDSDRYSFSLSLASVPTSQRHLMLEQIKQHTDELGEMQQTEIPDPQRDRERLTNMYVQDLYRFFKLFSRRREFAAAFDGDMDFTQLPCLGQLLNVPDNLQLLAEFYFKNAFYDDAVKCYNHLLEVSDNADPHIFQKLGFCHQSLGHTAQALEQYRRYELADDTDPWTIKHMAACHRALGQFNEALACYQRVERLQPGNVANTINMGHCLLEQGKTDEAMQLYFKADLAEEGGKRHRAWRPVAWCSFLLGNDGRSLHYYDRIIAEGTPTAQDHLNRGHVLMTCNRTQEALDSYRRALAIAGEGTKWLRDAILSDQPALLARGIPADDIPLLIDAAAQAAPTAAPNPSAS